MQFNHLILHLCDGYSLTLKQFIHYLVIRKFCFVFNQVLFLVVNTLNSKMDCICDGSQVTAPTGEVSESILLLSASRQKSLIEGFYNYTSGCSATILGGLEGNNQVS